MNPCDSYHNDLDAYRDDFLDSRRKHEVAIHLQQCANCQLALQQADSIERQLKGEASKWMPPDELWWRIKHSAIFDTSIRPRGYRKLSWMAAAMLLIAISVIGFERLSVNEEFLPENVASALVNEFHTFVVSQRELDFPGSEPEAIREWFSSRVDFRVPEPVRVRELELSGGRLCNMFDQRIVSFMYRIDGAWVSLYIMKPSPKVSNHADTRELLIQGYGFIDWESEGLRYSLIGEIPVKHLRRLAESLQSENLPVANLDVRALELNKSRDAKKPVPNHA